jgi:hypothetical protein
VQPRRLAAGPDDWEPIDTRIEDDVSIGSNATILCGLRIGKGAMVRGRGGHEGRARGRDGRRQSGPRPRMIASLSIVARYNGRRASGRRRRAARGRDGHEAPRVIVCNAARATRPAILERLAARAAPPHPRSRQNRGIEASIRALYACAHHEWISRLPRRSPGADGDPGPDGRGGRARRRSDLGVCSNKAAVTRRIAAHLVELDAIVRALGAPSDPGSIKPGRRELLDVPVVATGVSPRASAWSAPPAPARRSPASPSSSARESGKATGARDVVVRAAIDAVRVASLTLGWPRPIAPGPCLAARARAAGSPSAAVAVAR